MTQFEHFMHYVCATTQDDVEKRVGSDKRLN